MRTTKADLERTNAYLRERIWEKDTEIAQLKELVGAYKRPHDHLASFVIAAEKITDALAHVITNLNKGGRT